MSGNKPDLLPCPFCGGKALNVEWVTSHDERGWAVACKNPECLMNQGARILRTEAEAAEAWNRRAERRNAKCITDAEYDLAVMTVLCTSMCLWLSGKLDEIETEEN